MLSYSESSLDKIIMYSHLLPDMATVKAFMTQGFIYLNSQLSLQVSTIVIKNDLIQLVVSLWYYIINK